jgi:hypothetical protein
LATIEINSSNLHLWVLKFPENVEITSYTAMVEESIRRNPSGLRYAVLMDMRLSKAIPKKARQEAADLMKQHSDWFSEVVVCTVRVTPNPVLRGALTVYDWFAPSSWPRKAVSSGVVAEAWARSKLAAAGISCAPEPVWREQSESLAAPSSQSK